ncbi:Detected protein of unknown function [Hibiscus syriacus]|uniref:Uncharacterized protein n=1 Tax=Hibiscus syriacus TaxID=106335 RepID=A0A6A2WA84_HIBSY|nr:Detected protein of unknown function [Hibiscus syriacus]
MASALEQFSSRRNDEQSEFSLKEWDLKDRIRPKTLFREDIQVPISEILEKLQAHSDPTSPFPALRRLRDVHSKMGSILQLIHSLQLLKARSLYNSLECSPEGFALNSKWNEAEKYICNPLSGEFPMECFSAKTLSGRSFRRLTKKITVSAPLVYPSRTVQEDIAHFPIPETTAEGLTREAGTQSTPHDPSSGSPSSVSTPPIVERALNRSETENGDSPVSNTKTKSDEQVCSFMSYVVKLAVFYDTRKALVREYGMELIGSLVVR